MRTSRKAYVFWSMGKRFLPLGILLNEENGFRFRYSRYWISHRASVAALCPSMPVCDIVYESKDLFPVFRDACPDRWGRKMMGILSDKPFGALPEFDVLVGVHSLSRFGALVFGPTADGPASTAEWAIPEVALNSVDDIHMFQKMIWDISDDDFGDCGKFAAYLKVFRAMVSSLSLGGGRPKAFAYLDGHAWIVKFPRSGDLWDDPAVEHASMTFAEKCGIKCAETRLLQGEGGLAQTLLVRRFDRSQGLPRHVLSGFTFCGLAEDGDWKSYQHMAECARLHGDASAGREIFKRMVFNAYLGNTDDHPRNHAFFYDQLSAGATLGRMTPAYDITPFTPAKSLLALDCGKKGRAATVENLLSDVAPFGLLLEEAEKILEGISEEFKNWESHFSKYCTDYDMEKIEPIINHVPNQSYPLRKPLLSNAP